MTEDEIATLVVDRCYRVHKGIGPGLLESVYEAILARELTEAGLHVQRQVLVPIVWRGASFDAGFRADLLIEDKVIAELKAATKLLPIHRRQLLTHLRLSDRRLGLLVNFGEYWLKDGITRVVNGLPETA